MLIDSEANDVEHRTEIAQDEIVGKAKHLKSLLGEPSVALGIAPSPRFVFVGSAVKLDHDARRDA